MQRLVAVVAFVGVLVGGVCVMGVPDLPHIDLPSLLPDLRPAEAGTGSGGGSCRSVDGWDREQMRNARTIAEVGREMDMPDRAIVVALATAMQESGLHNTTDHPPGEDSAGLFQQRPSQGWGSHSQVMDPEHAARSFYRTLRDVDSWQAMRVTEAAQRVQRSAYPEAYEKWADDARELAKELAECGQH